MTCYAAPYGKFKLTAVFDTVMIDNGVFRYSMHGPDFDTFKVFNPENKSYIQTSVAAFAQQWAPSIQYKPLKKVGENKILGLDCQRFEGEAFQKGATIDGWYTNSIAIDKKLAASFCKICGLPPGYGVPVKVLIKDRKGATLLFELSKVAKTKSASEPLLVPKSYRFEKDHALFFLADEDGSNTGADELFRSVPLKEKKKKGD